jgi:prepilin-type N-terminal cleavage/methylation domain-containing protein
MKRNQSGFTLIEIAIVLVIIGLLLGGVLKGQELINSAKVKNLATDFKNIPIYIYGYQDKYKALPGDDKDVVAHLGAAASQVATTVGNGIINGDWNSTNTTDESYIFWQHIRLAGFGPGSTVPGAPGYVPTNAVGGTIGITNSLLQTNGGNRPIAGIVGTYIVCSGAIPYKFAKQLDTTLDDGIPNTGSVMEALPTGGDFTSATAIPSGGWPAITTGTAPTDDTPVLVCMGY